MLSLLTSLGSILKRSPKKRSPKALPVSNEGEMMEENYDAVAGTADEAVETAAAAGNNQVDTEFEQAALEQLRMWRELAQEDPGALAIQFEEAAKHIRDFVKQQQQQNPQDPVAMIMGALQDVLSRLAKLEGQSEGGQVAAETAPAEVADRTVSTKEKIFSPRGAQRNGRRDGSGRSLREIVGV